MSYFEDLSPHHGINVTWRGVRVKSVGWLSSGYTYPVAPPSLELLDALWAHCAVLVNPTRGVHSCEFCAKPANTFVRHGTRLLLGTAEIVVMTAKGKVFAAPNLVYHYVSEHHYRPPDVFCLAAEAGLDPGSPEYREMLGRLGASWQENVPREKEPEWFRFERGEDGVVRKVRVR